MWCQRFIQRGLGAVVLLAATAFAGPNNTELTSKQLYNQGTQKLKDGKLREAETSLQTAVASQDERVQSAAIYNLGHVRFQQGIAELKNGPDGKNNVRQAQAATESGDEAIRQADTVLNSPDLDGLVEAYMRGRGARKELKGAAEAVKRAMESYGNVLAKWQRASGDFKSADELRGRDTDAQHNAEVVDRSIARLVDTQQMMMESQQCVNQKRQELGKKMKELKGKMTKEQQQQCKNGEEDEEEEEEKNSPKEPDQAKEEAKPKEGRETPLTPEEAARLLELLKLDADRKLPLGQKDTGVDKEKKRRNW